MFISKQASTE